MKRKYLLPIPLLLCLSGCLYAQSANGIIAPSRAIDWSTAGVPGTIPNRTSICATLSPGATASQINSAIANCPNGQVVYLNAGTYMIGSPGITFGNKRSITLRGAGPDKTFLIFSSSNGCGGLGASICVQNGQNNWAGDPGNTANWTAGYSKGATTITLSSTANLKVGTPLILDQLNDSNTDTGEVWVCGDGGLNVCCVSCAAGAGRSGPRDQTQVVKVTAINGNQITIEDPLLMPNWRSDRSPGAWWSSDTAISAVGIEDLSVDHAQSGGSSGIGFFNAHGCWAKNVRSLHANRSHIWLYQSAHITVRDSYFYGTQNSTSQSYGIEHYTASRNVIENNIFQHIAAPMLTNNGNGSVFGYNFVTDDYYSTSPDAAMAAAWHHGAGTSYHLYEGNDWSIGLRADYFHGLSQFTTAFRNRFQGWESGKSQLTVPILLQMGHRYFNIVGNVLGRDSYHNAYQVAAGGSESNCNTSIFALGWGGYCGSGSLRDDPLVAGTLMRWGNFDTVNDATRWNASDVPTGISKYANPLPANQTLPTSFYLPGKPSWWGTPWGNPPWPAIGPEVTGGPGPGGHAHKIPAQLCYEKSAKDGSGRLTFNAASCYQHVPSPTPAPPTNLSLTVH
jgi:hypothetical protein